jgi:hypothetical protein
LTNIKELDYGLSMTDLTHEELHYPGYPKEDVVTARGKSDEGEQQSPFQTPRRNFVEGVAWKLTQIIGGGKTSAPQAEIRTVGPKGQKLPEIISTARPDNVVDFPGNRGDAA